MNKPLIILKLGGSIITYKDHPSGKLRTKRLKEIALEIKKALKEKGANLILINGAGSYGHPIAKKYGIVNGIKNKTQARGFCEIKQTVQLLTTRLNKIFLEAGLNTFLCQTSSLVIQNQGAIDSFNLQPIKQWLRLGFIPFLSGDVVADMAWGGSICSGDTLAPYLAKKLGAKRILYASDVEGIFDRNPQIYPSAKFIPKITKRNFPQIIKLIGESSHLDVTGGMKGKILKLATGLPGIPITIFSGLKKDNIYKAMSGVPLGTIVNL